MIVFINILNLDIIKEVFTKYNTEGNCKIYYDLYDSKNLDKNLILEEFKEDEKLSFYENNKLYIQNYNIYTFIDSLIIASIFNFEIILPDTNISEIKKLEFIDLKIYNKLLIIEETEYFINFINLIKQNKIYSNLLNFNYKNYFENFIITDLSKLLIFIIIKNEHMSDNINKIKKITDLTTYDNKKMDKFISGLLIEYKLKVKIKKYYRIINLLYCIKDLSLLMGYLCRSYTEENHDIFDYSIKVYNNFVSEYTDSIININDILKLKSITKELIIEKTKEISYIHKKFKEGDDVISIIDYQDCIILVYKFLYENNYINLEKINNEILNKIFDSCLCDVRANKLIGLASDGNKHNNNMKYKNKYENYKKKLNQLKKLFDLINENCNNK